MAVKRTPNISADRPLINDDNSPSAQFLFWTNLITSQAIIIGEGSPNGVIEAEQASLYMDESGISGLVLYIKRDADVLGDKTQGWVLV